VSHPLPHDGPTPSHLRASHTPDAIRRRLNVPPEPSYLRDAVYGAIDGAVTTFAVVSGVAGAGLSSNIVLVLGLANLVGDGFSMAAGNYLGTRADEQLRDRARQTEMRHIEQFPEGEREEIRQIFAAQGFTGDALERAVAVITSDPDRWIDMMLKDEYGLPMSSRNPVRAAVCTFIAFLIIGSLPLLPFVLDWLLPAGVPEPYAPSTALTASAFFLVGAAKSRFVSARWYWSGAETLLVGGAAAALAYGVGALLTTVHGG
jgi:VIT1/CCC1 family predicted Fe2+/Mn2+ transporter